MSDYNGFLNKQEPIHTVDTLVVQLQEMQKLGYGNHNITVRGEYALDNNYTIDKSWCDDSSTIDFYGQA